LIFIAPIFALSEGYIEWKSWQSDPLPLYFISYSRFHIPAVTSTL